jgi:hypothetical protein
VQRKAREARVKEDQYKRAQKGKEAQELQKIESEAETARRLEEEAAQLLAEQKRKDLERLEKELEAAALKREPSPPKEKLGFFSRKRGATMTAPTPSLSTSAPVTSPPLPGNRSASSSSAPTKADGSPARTINSAGKKGIEQGGGGIVPQTDAPISASNAGERVSFNNLGRYMTCVLTSFSEYLYGVSNRQSPFPSHRKPHPWTSYTRLQIS